MKLFLSAFCVLAMMSQIARAEQWKLVWSDEFEGSVLNTEYWSYETGSGGWGNNELQNYTAGENMEIRDGKFSANANRDWKG